MNDNIIFDFKNAAGGFSADAFFGVGFSHHSEILAKEKSLVMCFGDKFCFIGNQHRIVFEEQEHFIDLLFFNRELRCLVAIELKRGEFKPQYLGQLQFYLSLLDDYIRLDNTAENGESEAVE